MSDREISHDLVAEKLSFSFYDSNIKRSNEVIREVSLSAKPGEVTAIVGPSGCGKSTLLYLLGLLERPASGEIFLSGKSMAEADDASRTSERNLSIGFVFQFHFLIKELTALENARLPALKSGKDRGLADAQSLAVLDRLGLRAKADRPASKLSGGEQQRVAIARALANSPRYLLADEPTGNLDSSNSSLVFDLLMEFACEKSIAVVLVTHNLDLAARSHRMLEMRDGELIS